MRLYSDAAGWSLTMSRKTPATGKRHLQRVLAEYVRYLNHWRPRIDRWYNERPVRPYRARLIETLGGTVSLASGSTERDGFVAYNWRPFWPKL
jgi:hypothetical protein